MKTIKDLQSSSAMQQRKLYRLTRLIESREGITDNVIDIKPKLGWPNWPLNRLAEMFASCSMFHYDVPKLFSRRPDRCLDKQQAFISQNNSYYGHWENPHLLMLWHLLFLYCVTCRLLVNLIGWKEWISPPTTTTYELSFSDISSLFKPCEHQIKLQVKLLGGSNFASKVGTSR